MYRKIINNVISIPLLVLFLNGCTDPGPYIFKANEFDRSSQNFAKELEDRSKVEICYNKFSTTPAILMQIAQDECSRFGKAAQFVSNRNLVCSIGSPARATFWCLCPEDVLRNELKKNTASRKTQRKLKCLKP